MTRINDHHLNDFLWSRQKHLSFTGRKGVFSNRFSNGLKLLTLPSIGLYHLVVKEGNCMFHSTSKLATLARNQRHRALRKKGEEIHFHFSSFWHMFMCGAVIINWWPTGHIQLAESSNLNKTSNNDVGPKRHF